VKSEQCGLAGDYHGEPYDSDTPTDLLNMYLHVIRYITEAEESEMCFKDNC